MELKKYSIKTTSRENIEAEEIFLDAEAIRSLEDKGKLEQPIKSRNFILFYILIVVSLLGLLARAAYLQIIKVEHYRNLAEGNRIRVYSVPAPRGIIYDRQEQPLVYNVPSFDLKVHLADFLANPVSVQEEILEKISVILTKAGNSQNSSVAEFELNEDKMLLRNNMVKKIEQAKGKLAQVVLAEDIEHSTALILASLASDWSGVRLEKNIRRQYVLAPELAHTLGYTGQVSPADLEAHPQYQPNDDIGKTGLEFQYEELLRGQPGQEQIETDVLGQTKKFLAFKPAQPGQGLVLFIDRGLQEKLYQSLNKMLSRLKVKKAAAIAVDPRNGGILALVSLPTFDNNLFAQGISSADYNSLTNNPHQPLFNRVIAGQYPPGSTIKPLIAAAALEEGIIQPNQQINCQGSLEVSSQYGLWSFLDWKTHGLTDIIKAIAQSCNVYFYRLGGGYGQFEGLGIERIKKYLRLFGLGELTHIDLPVEEKGLIPDKIWKKETKGEKWYIGDTYHVAIGQGDIAVTPLQIALATAVIANGGILYQPQLVDKIVDSEKNVIKDIQPTIIRQGFISQESLAIVSQGMRQAVVSGSAQALAGLSVKVAGKTGTAQFGNQDQTHAWFTGFAPYEHPEIVLTILVEGGGEGHRAAVPVAQEVFEWWFSR
jgi:penicillin-binding protein 2